jgi:hypothetical protein
MAEARADIIALSDYVYQRTRGRLAGLTDEEYFWEPVPGCLTVRRTEAGNYRADHAAKVKVPPFTTIAWRLWHLIGCYAEARNAAWLGVPQLAGSVERGDPAPGSAEEAVAALEQAGSFWHTLLEALPAGAWSEKLGPAAGPFADDDKTSLVLHQLDEQIHHGAELGVLRDLYRSQP